MPARLAPLGALARLVGVLALLGLVAMHVAVAPAHTGHGTMDMTASVPAVATTAMTTTVLRPAGTLRVPSAGVAADGGAGCPTTHHGQGASTMDCTGTAAPAGPGQVSLAAPVLSHLPPPAALPQWPSPRPATFAPSAAAPTRVILRT